jgi:putative hydrolase of HD superfamily
MGELQSQEYEARETPESKFVKDLDRIELVIQAIVSRRRHAIHQLGSKVTD